MNLFELFVKIGVDDQASSKLKDLGGKLGNGLKTAAKIGTAAVGAAAAGITALTTAAVNNYAEYEQLVGGVETLFKDSSDYVREAASQAFKTAGLSANNYMETVTSFSASLLQSLENDTEAAAEYADLAITDMADNANKMGTSMEMIQNAYQGFAKQNYTMLDNLKLGYGGTKTEMQRLISDAAELSDTVDAQSMSFANIVEAIHVVQTEMGITGTTAREAGTTIQGSVASMKAAWSNLTVALTNDAMAFEYYLEDFVTTIVGDGTESNLGVIGNVLPAVETALGGIIKLIEGSAPKIVEILPGLVDQIVPSLISAATGIVDAVVGVVPDLLQTVVSALINNAPALIESATALVESLVQGIQDNYQMLVDGAAGIVTQITTNIIGLLPEIIALGLDLIVSLANGIAESLPELIPTIIEVMMKIVDTLTQPETLSNLLDAALAVILTLADGLVQFIPALIDATITLIDRLITFLLEPENIKKLAEAAVEIVVALAEGLVKSVGTLMESTGELISNVVEKFKETDWAQVGEDVVNGIWEGLEYMWDDLSEWFYCAWENLVGGVKDLLGIHSPSRVFADIGKNMALGVRNGWEDEFGDIKKDIDKSLVFDDATMGVSASVKSVPGIFDNRSNYGGVSVIQNIYSEAKTAADLMQEALYHQERAVLLGV